MTGAARTGIGFDAHAFDESRRLVLGGVEIPDHPGLAGHSDADVLVHAICDAILGACALGDIGKHFPDTDPEWKGRLSLDILGECAEMAKTAGFDIAFIDSTAVLETPKLAKYIEDMRANIAYAIGHSNNSLVSVKATTTEKMGFTGRGEGVAAMAVVTVIPAERAGRNELEKDGKSKSAARTAGIDNLPATVYRHAPGSQPGDFELTPMLSELGNILCYTDGASLGNPGPSGCAAVICEPSGASICAFHWRIKDSTNNVAEYTALLRLLEFLLKAGVRSKPIEVRMDSELVVKQVNGQYKVKSDSIAALFADSTAAAGQFQRIKIAYVPRAQNAVADYFAKEASKFKR